nr:protein unc-13 homolog [Ipomoea batatas]
MKSGRCNESERAENNLKRRNAYSAMDPDKKRKMLDERNEKRRAKMKEAQSLQMSPVNGEKSTDVTKSSVQKNTFDGSRKDINADIDQICEFTGTKIIFWDLREPFINNLYKPTAAQSRFEALMDTLDTVLSELCSVIMEPLRDRVVTGLLQASLDGLLRVILDGGPSRIFYASDATVSGAIGSAY